MTTDKNNSAAAPASKPISIQRTLNLPVKKVWQAWSDASTMKKWWGPNNYTCPHCTIDFKEGGKYLACMKGPDGKETWSTGTYKKIVPEQKIVVTDSFADEKGNIINASEYGMPGEWPMECLVTLEFKDNGGKTDLSLTHEGIPAEMQSDCVKGWQQCLDKLEKI
jgi:uncharacterized protein YndB with AHSA1/START domain